LRLTRLPIVTRGRQGGAELIHHDVEVIEKGVDRRDPAVIDVEVDRARLV